MLGTRLALVAAFPFPLPQGSQVFAASQACALADAGADVTLVCYGHGAEADPTALAGERSLRESGVVLRRAPGFLTRTPLRAGPSVTKPLADAALLATLLSAQRTQRFDAILAHNAEAALVALAARAVTGVPVVYVAHTLLRHELSAYAPALLTRPADAAGACLDAFLARNADAVLALSRAAESELSEPARGPLECIPPGLDPAAPPTSEEIDAACERAELRRGRFALYAGNLDAYQDLALLAEAGRRLARERKGGEAIIVATHDPRRNVPRPLQLVRTTSAAEARALTFGAGVAVIARRRPGGFPVKLLNYMEAGRAIVGFHGVVDGLVHGREAWLLPPQAGAAGLARTLAQLLDAPAVAAQLGGAARRRLERAHRWSDLAQRTLALTSLATDALASTRVASATAPRRR